MGGLRGTTEQCVFPSQAVSQPLGKLVFNTDYCQKKSQADDLTSGHGGSEILIWVRKSRPGTGQDQTMHLSFVLRLQH